MTSQPEMSEMQAGLIQMMEALHEMEEMARGFREHLLSQGWSEHSSEAVAVHMLDALVQRAIQ